MGIVVTCTVIKERPIARALFAEGGSVAPRTGCLVGIVQCYGKAIDAIGELTVACSAYANDTYTVTLLLLGQLCFGGEEAAVAHIVAAFPKEIHTVGANVEGRTYFFPFSVGHTNDIVVLYSRQIKLFLFQCLFCFIPFSLQ